MPVKLSKVKTQSYVIAAKAESFMQPPKYYDLAIDARMTEAKCRRTGAAAQAGLRCEGFRFQYGITRPESRIVLHCMASALWE